MRGGEVFGSRIPATIRPSRSHSLQADLHGDIHRHARACDREEAVAGTACPAVNGKKRAAVDLRGGNSHATPSH